MLHPCSALSWAFNFKRAVKMAKAKKNDNAWVPKKNRKNKRTSIGRSKNSRPKNKHSNKSVYRGQGK